MNAIKNLPQQEITLTNSNLIAIQNGFLDKSTMRLSKLEQISHDQEDKLRKLKDEVAMVSIGSNLDQQANN